MLNTLKGLSDIERNAFLIVAKRIVCEMYITVKDIIKEPTGFLNEKYGSRECAAFSIIESMDVLKPLIKPFFLRKSDVPYHNILYIDHSLRDSIVYTDMYKTLACVETLSNMIEDKLEANRINKELDDLAEKK